MSLPSLTRGSSAPTLRPSAHNDALRLRRLMANNGIPRSPLLEGSSVASSPPLLPANPVQELAGGSRGRTATGSLIVMEVEEDEPMSGFVCPDCCCDFGTADDLIIHYDVLHGHLGSSRQLPVSADTSVTEDSFDEGRAHRIRAPSLLPVPHGWYSGTGGTAGLTVRVELYIAECDGPQDVPIRVVLWSSSPGVFNHRDIPGCSFSLDQEADDPNAFVFGPKLMGDGETFVFQAANLPPANARARARARAREHPAQQPT